MRDAPLSELSVMRREARKLRNRAYRLLDISNRLRERDPVRSQQAFEEHRLLKRQADFLRDRVQRAERNAERADERRQEHG